jgi:GTPase SAR1 family protein
MKIAIVIWGVQNSGKSSTFKGIVHNYSEKQITQMRRGWQRLFLNSKFKCLKLDSYFFPASPTESETNLENYFKSPNFMPQVLFLAEQINGKNASNTKAFLHTNGYSVFDYFLSNTNGRDIWDRFDNLTEQMKLKARADEIIMDIRDFIKKNQII